MKVHIYSGNWICQKCQKSFKVYWSYEIGLNLVGLEINNRFKDTNLKPVLNRRYGTTYRNICPFCRTVCYESDILAGFQEKKISIIEEIILDISVKCDICGKVIQNLQNPDIALCEKCLSETAPFDDSEIKSLIIDACIGELQEIQKHVAFQRGLLENSNTSSTESICDIQNTIIERIRTLREARNELKNVTYEHYSKDDEVEGSKDPLDLLSLYRSGINVKEIANKHDMTDRQVLHRMIKAGIFKDRNHPEHQETIKDDGGEDITFNYFLRSKQNFGKKWSEEDVDMLIRLYDSGASIQYMSTRLGRTENSIQMKLIHLEKGR
jgi:hypothetical protein